MDESAREQGGSILVGREMNGRPQDERVLVAIARRSSEPSQVWRHDKNEVLIAQLDAETRAWNGLAVAIERANAALERRIMLKSQLEPQQ